jgi:hypothetical protein
MGRLGEVKLIPAHLLLSGHQPELAAFVPTLLQLDLHHDAGGMVATTGTLHPHNTQRYCLP